MEKFTAKLLRAYNIKEGKESYMLYIKENNAYYNVEIADIDSLKDYNFIDRSQEFNLTLI